MRKLIWLFFFVFLFQGCSYYIPFVICNNTQHPITISYRMKDGHSYDMMFSDTPTVQTTSVDGEDVELGTEVKNVHWTSVDGISISIPPGTALVTGFDSRPRTTYPSLDYLMIIQGSDTTKLSGAILPSLVRDLDNQVVGLIIK
ncbi:MAG TPA: hypothetical protein VGE21_05680 [Flavobacteriales bacterium]